MTNEQTAVLGKPWMKEKPFYLDGGAVRWVEETYRSMTTEDKLRQLFCLVTYQDDESFCRYLGEEVRPGGFMSRMMPARSCVHTVTEMQKYSKIPMLVAANFEAGGNGMISDGTAFAKPMAIAATKDFENARRLGEIVGIEGRAVGANWAFAPIVDLDLNWRNPITNTRTFGSDPETVAGMGVAYLTEVQKHGIAACAKHFPGDGCDERDQHVAPSVNSLSCGEWDSTYGSVWRAVIDAGVKTVMVGHILLPAYARRLDSGNPAAEWLPASVNRALVTGLLRRQLGFNGLIVTDSTVMAGLTALLPREELVPMTIAAGCDLFLFTKNLEEDLGFMRKGYESGVFDDARLDDAVLHILALKASLGLHEQQKQGRLAPDPAVAAKQIGQKKFRSWCRACADGAITLVKEEAGVLPITPERYPRVLYYPIAPKSGEETIFGTTQDPTGEFADRLRAYGFDVTVFEPVNGFEGMLGKVRDVTDRYDLILYAASLATKSNQTVVRIEWQNPMGANVPVYCHSVPTVFVSFENPYHLVDVPQVRTYINCYCGYPHFLDALVEKLTGKSPFRGISPSDPFCGKPETRL